MIPLHDVNRSNTTPFVTRTLILANVAVFIWELTLGRQLGQAFLQFALIPARYTHPAEAAEVFGRFADLGAALTPFVSSMFFHGGWMHLIGNMWCLWIFGDNVEDRLGHVRYLLLYLAGGVAAALMHLATNANSAVPTLGASGAIAGVMGAYFCFFPTARIVAILPPFIFWPIVLPAVVFLGWWFFLQFFNGAFALADRGQSFSGIAWWAHVGGFVFGLLFALMARVDRRRPTRVEAL